jgi:hypothetical protein
MLKTKSILIYIILLLFLIGVLSDLSFAGVTGKITGIVRDKNNGDPLIGANILVEGETFGAASDINGRYFILSIPPGTYTLSVSMIGYSKVTVEDVRVIIDHTTTVNMDLESQAIDMGREVVVTAQRPVIQKDITNSTQFVGLEELTQLPVTDAKEGLMIQTGIFLDPLPISAGFNGQGRGEPRYSIRGGGQGEVKWFIDGVRSSSLIEGRADQGGSFTDVNMHAISEVQLITSGFNAEYGEAQSGIVNVVTKEGGDKYSFSFEYIHGLAGQHHFGNYMYSHPTENQYQNHWNALNSEHQSWVSAWGAEVPTPDDSLAHIEYITNLDNLWWEKYQKEYRDHMNVPASVWWNENYYNYRDTTAEIGTIDPDWMTPYRQKNIYDYRKIPDQNLFFSLGGPLFRIGNLKSSFFIASQIKKEAYIYPHPRDTHDQENVTYNVVFQSNSKAKLRCSGFYNHEAHSTWQEYGQFVPQAKYYRGWGTLLDTYTYSNSLLWSHILSQQLFYDLKLSYYLTDIREKPSDYTEIGQSDMPDIWGFQRYNIVVNFSDDESFVEPFDAWAFVWDNHWKNSDISLVGSLNWQWNSFNFLKTGFELRYNTMSELKAYRYPSYIDRKAHPELWMNRGLHDTYHPIQLAFYAQNKMEFESMILNIGLRYDYFNPNREWFATNNLYNYSLNPDFNPALDPDADQLDSLGNVKYSFENVMNQPMQPAPSYHMVSPRLGVSFPITENTLLHFNYGHFYQMPPLDRMFELSYFRPEKIIQGILAEIDSAAAQGREPNHVPSDNGDPERLVFLTAEPLKPEKTISFEVGIKQNFSDIAVLDVTAFYKDAFNKTEARYGIFDRRIYGWDPINSQTTPNLFYVSSFPGDYGDARGFEITLRTLFSRVFTLDINYSFSKSTIGRASPGQIKIDGDGNYTYVWDTDVNKRIPVQNSYSRPHTVRTNIFFKYSDNLKVPFLTAIFRGTSVSILHQFISGQPFTYQAPDDPPDTYDNYRYPAYQSVDLRLSKIIEIGDDHIFSAYIRVTNLFNRKNLISLGDIYYNDPKEVLSNYIDSGTIPKVDVAGYDITPQTYAPARRIYFGIKYNLR